MDLCINKTTPVKQDWYTPATSQPYEEDNNLPDIHCRKSFPTWIFWEEDSEVVQAIPNLPNGKKPYKIYTGQDTWHEVTSDLRFFDIKTSSRSRYSGVCKVGKCLGSWICPNKNCTFRATSDDHQPNRINWKGVRERKDIKICQICKTVVMQEGCGARKLVEFNPTTWIAYIYHLGNHTCQGKIDRKKKKRPNKKQNTSQGLPRNWKRLGSSKYWKHIDILHF